MGRRKGFSCSRECFVLTRVKISKGFSAKLAKKKKKKPSYHFAWKKNQEPASLLALQVADRVVGRRVGAREPLSSESLYLMMLSTEETPLVLTVAPLSGCRGSFCHCDSCGREQGTPVPQEEAGWLAGSLNSPGRTAFPASKQDSTLRIKLT